MPSVPAVAAAVAAAYRGFSSSIVTDALARFGVGAWMDDVLPVNPAWRVSGRVRTMCYAPRSGMKHAGHTLYTMAERVEPGDVVILAAAGTRGWLLGENMAHFCINHRLAGLVTDGRVRDALELAELPLPIFSAGTSARPSSSEVEVVAVDVPVRCAGAYVRPGDFIVGDRDGIVVAPHEAIEALVLEAEELLVLEKEQEIAIRDGAPAAAIAEISRRKKVRKGPAFDAVARKA
ncbi:MAG: RraA family protein [Alphaproteobacteria bacterium]|nr:RraA family protein [Alphaproteobacteria bacterium]